MAFYKGGTYEERRDKVWIAEIIQSQIKAVSDAFIEGDLDKFYRSVSILESTVVSHVDRDYVEEIQREMDKIKIDASKGIRKKEQSPDYYISRFRAIMNLIQRSDFTSEKKIEGVLDERTFDAIKRTSKKS